MSKNEFTPFMDEIGRLREEVGRLKAENESLKEFKDRIMDTIYKAPELDEHGNSKPYRYDNLITELRAACNQEEGPVWEAPWRVVK